MDMRWAYYQLLTQDINGQDSGSAIPSLSRPDFYALPVMLPSLPEQEAIGQLLGALDDKIDLNRRSNATVKSLLRALFRRLPDDGRAMPIESIAKVVGGSTPSTVNAAYWEGGAHPWATPKDLASLREPVLLDTARHLTDAGLAQIGSGLLPAGVVLLSSRAPIGYLAISEVPVAINQGFIALIPTRSVSKHFLMWWAESNLDEIKARANGTTFQEISKANFRPITVTVPSTDELKRFDDVAEPLHELLVANARETRVLAELRDALLPELISGRVTLN
jgi:type I restriction enzyme S subunit